MQVLLFNNNRAAVVLTLSTLVGVILLVSHSVIEVEAARTTDHKGSIGRHSYSHNLRSTSRRYLDIDDDEAAAYPDLYSSSLDESNVTESDVTNSDDEDEASTDPDTASNVTSDDEEDINDDEFSTEEEASNVTLFVGDSDIEYWKTTNTDFPQSHNVGVAGWTASQVNKKITGFLAEYPPTDWVVLVCGENDLYYGSNVKKTFEYFKKIVKEVLTTTGARVLYIGTKPEPATTDLHGKYKEYDQKIRDYAKQLSDGRNRTTLTPPLVMIDTYPHFESIGNPSSLYQKDKLHLSKNGYFFWNKWTNYVFENADSQCQVYQNNKCTQE